MRILFYRPVVTPRWFEQVIKPLIRRVADAAEVQVLAPAPWCNTGLGSQELERVADLTNVQWAIVDDAAFGVPMFRQSRFASAAWPHAGTDLDVNEAFYPTDTQPTAAMVIERTRNPVDPARRDTGMARLQRHAALEFAA